MGAFGAMERVARVMAGFSRPWFVSGGWAIDLFVGKVTREHEDLEVGLYRHDQEALWAYLSAWQRGKCVQGAGGMEWVPWGEAEWLELPVFQLRAQRAEGDPVEIEFFLNDAADGAWICRRNAAIKRPVAEINGRSIRGIPFLVPEIQLLYKAKRHRPKDEHDFQTALVLLTAPQREWLKESLEIVHPGDPWIAALQR